MPEKEGDSKNSLHQLLLRFSYGVFFFFFAHLRGAACGFGAIVGNGRGGCGQRIELVDLWPFVCCGEETGEGGMGNCNRQGGEAGKLASGTFLLSLWPTNGARETKVPGSVHLRPGSWF